MKEIPLTNSLLKVLVDDEDLEFVLKHSKTWCLSGRCYAYATSQILRDYKGRKKPVAMHRLILRVPFFNENGLDTDHINRNTLDNRKENLRFVPHNLNCANCAKQKGIKSSKYKGVSWDKNSKKWRVSSRKNRCLYYGGLYINELEAAKVANELMKKLFGEYAVLNVI